MADISDEDLLAELDATPEAKPHRARSPREERIIAGFEDIQKFVETHGRPPLHGEDRDIFERIYAVRLDRLREQDDCRALLAEFDTRGLLSGARVESAMAESLDDDALLAELGVEAVADDDVTVLKHVKSRADVRAAEEIADRTVCKDFESFKPLFVRIRKDLDAGVRKTRPFARMAEIKQGEFFIVGGQMAYVATVGEEFDTKYGRRDSRLRVIYDNGTESDVLLRSLQRALHRDEAGRRVTNPSAGPLFGSEENDDDIESGTIYVLRSKSDHPEVAAHREIIHKIGVTGGDVKKRVAIADKDATYLLADVEIVAEYKIYNVSRTGLENLFHRFFAAARLDIEIKDRFGNPVKPREWYLAPLSVIDEVVGRIRDNSITEFAYNPATVSLEKIAGEA